MEEIDEKIKDVYAAIERSEARITDKIDKTEIRANLSTNEKIDSIKNYLHTLHEARTEAVITTLKRVENGHLACSGRCEGITRSFESRLTVLEREALLELSKHDKYKESLEQLKSSTSGMKESVDNLETWKRMNWQRTIIYAVAAIAASVQIVTWANSFIKALIPGP